VIDDEHYEVENKWRFKNLNTVTCILPLIKYGI